MFIVKLIWILTFSARMESIFQNYISRNICHNLVMEAVFYIIYPLFSLFFFSSLEACVYTAARTGVIPLKNAMQHLVDTLSIDTVCELMPLFALVIL
jgi:hypothetical protein